MILLLRQFGVRDTFLSGSSRSDGNLLAGDDLPYYHYKVAQFARHFLPRMRPQGRSVLEVGCGRGRACVG